MSEEKYMEAARIIAELFDGYVTCIDQKEPDGFFACVKIEGKDTLTFLKFKDAMDHIHHVVMEHPNVSKCNYAHDITCMQINGHKDGMVHPMGHVNPRSPLEVRRLDFLRICWKLREQGFLN